MKLELLKGKAEKRVNEENRNSFFCPNCQPENSKNLQFCGWKWEGNYLYASFYCRNCFSSCLFCFASRTYSIRPGVDDSKVNIGAHSAIEAAENKKLKSA